MSVDIAEFLSRRINRRQVAAVVDWVMASPEREDSLLSMVDSPIDRLGINALWVMSSLPQSSDRLQVHRDFLIDRLLVETNDSKKRIFMQILRGMRYERTDIRTDFLDFCLSKINSETEPVAIRSYSVYCAFKMCRHFAELTAELEQHLDILSVQSLLPGLRCALSVTRREIADLHFSS